MGLQGLLAQRLAPQHTRAATSETAGLDYFAFNFIFRRSELIFATKTFSHYINKYIILNISIYQY